MRTKKGRKGKSLRRRLMENGPLICFYCGLPFGAYILPKGSPGAAKSRRFACITLEHLIARSLDGETTKENCVLAHGWCNGMASNRLLSDKLELKIALSSNEGLPPWWSVLQKLIGNQSV